jgi:predicted DNA-binding protein (UPF0251 family)
MVAFNPDISYFKPRGIPMRLADLQGLSHEIAGQHMHISRATFGRIIQRARKIVADALINGKAINVEGGNYKMVDQVRSFMCAKCNLGWVEPMGAGKPERCPRCNHDVIDCC